MEHKAQKIHDRFILYNISEKDNCSFKEDVINGLSLKQKSIPPKYFYDDTGSELFEKICSTEEYYVTRTESKILLEYASLIAKSCNGICNITELGSGSSVKTRYLLKAFLDSVNSLNYMPIDVSDILIQSGKELVNEFSCLNVTGVIGEYERSLKLISSLTTEPNLIIFLGSSIGNFDISHAEDFMRIIARNMKSNDKLLVGFDMVKDTEILNAAYNDSQGVTAEFNINLLKRINNELCGDFTIQNFEHNAFFNPIESRIEMHLVSKIDQDINVSGNQFHFLTGETIHTENSYKFTEEMIQTIANESGLKIIDKWSDVNNWFGLYLFNIKHP